MHVARMVEARRLSYRLLSEAFLYPLDERVDALAAACSELSRRKSWWDETPIRLEWAGFLKAGRAMGQNPIALRGEYSLAFLANSGTVRCPIRESAHLEEDPGTIAFVLADLEREYARAGLESRDQQETPLDHLATQLQLMAYLCSQEAEAWKSESIGDACSLLRHESRFLARHLLRWFPRVKVRAGTLGEGFHTAAIAATGAFISHDAGLLEGLVSRFESLAKREDMSGVLRG